MDDNTAKKKILLIKNSPQLNVELALFLQSKGFGVINRHQEQLADNYETATELIKYHHIDIIITGIRLNGEDDGLQLCAWAKSFLNVLVVIWSAHTNVGNLDRARYCGADYFIPQSADMAADMLQIWCSIYFSLPAMLLAKEKHLLGNYLPVKELDNLVDLPGFEKRKPGSVYQEAYIKWMEVSHIISYNVAKAGEGNNNILICSITNNKGFIYRAALGEIISRLPAYFVRFDKGTIVNLHHITAKGRGHDLFYIGHLQFRLSSFYKEDGLAKLQMLSNKNF